MIILTILILGFAPGIFWAWYFYKRDRLEPEPKSTVIKLFFYGILIAIPVAIIEQFIPFDRIFLIIIFAPIIEEFFKFIVVRITVYNYKEFNEPMDGIIYATALALGFASIENVGYIFSALKSGNLIQVTILRALLAVPGHALFSSMWGYALGLSKFTKKKSNRIIYNGLILAMLLHAIYNFFAMGIPFVGFGMIFFIIIIWKLLNKRINTLLNISPFLKENKMTIDEEPL